MKLIKVLPVCLLLLTACSESDESQIKEYSITISSACPGGSTTDHCVSENTYNNTKKSMDQAFGDPCIPVSFKDINQNNHNGYLRSVGRSNDEVPCRN